MAEPARVLVIGGAGYFGSLLVEELLEYTDAQIIIGGRNKKRIGEFCRTNPARLTSQEVDILQAPSVERALEQVQVAVCAAGPFQSLPTTLLEFCLARNVHYIDLSDNREFVCRARKLAADSARESRAAVCSGWSAVPALSGLLAAMAVENLTTIESINIQIAPGNRFPRSTGTVASLLSSVGHAFEVWKDGHWRTVTGWSEPRSFEFPEPVGLRKGYLVDVPDHEIFPRIFPAGCVEFRVSSEIQFFNSALSLLAWPCRKGWIQS